MSHFFVTGTDTGVGKSIATGLIAKALQNQGSVVTQKWIQTGCDQPVPSDIQTHRRLMNMPVESDQKIAKLICPYHYTYPAAPHLAAQKAHDTIDVKTIKSAFHALTHQFNHVIVEGSGGICVPITPSYLLIDLVQSLNLETIIVVDNKLGCINHTLLTLSALSARNIPIKGLIINTPEPRHSEDDMIRQDNIDIISQLTQLPILAIIPFNPTLEFQPITVDFTQKCHSR